MLIKVTEKHIQDSRKATLLTIEQCTQCPIALALFEQVYGGGYYIKYRGYSRSTFKIVFYKGSKSNSMSNVFSVANNIKVAGLLTGNNPPYHVTLPSEAKQFIINFDLGVEVEPFEFEFDFKL